MMKRFNKKENLGITLIALVITIVVLIILAGVIISITLGNGGIIDRAKTAKQEYSNAEGYEQTEIAKYTNDINSYISGNRDYTPTRKLLFDGEKSSGTITFENDSISNYSYFEFIFGPTKLDAEYTRFFTEIVSSDFLSIAKTMNSKAWLAIHSAANATGGACSIWVTGATDNSITFEGKGSGSDWNNWPTYIYKIIGIK